MSKRVYILRRSIGQVVNNFKNPCSLSLQRIKKSVDRQTQQKMHNYLLIREYISYRGEKEAIINNSKMQRFRYITQKHHIHSFLNHEQAT